MGSTISAIGFEVSDEDEFRALIERAANEGESLESPRGEYKRWRAEGGPELWVPLRKGTAGLVPAFDSTSSIRLSVDDVVQTGAKSPLEGIIIGTLPEDDDDLQVPWAVEIAGIDCDAAVLGRGAVVDIKVTAFAHEASTRPPSPPDAGNEEEPELDDDPGLADQALIPVWQFEEDQDAVVVMAGIVVSAQTRTNGLTGAGFHHVVIDTLGARVDVVIGPSDIPALPVVGDVLEGGFWLGGLIAGVVEPRERRRKWFRR
jgi:hypothetical protein